MHVNAQPKKVTFHSMTHPTTADCNVTIGNAKLSSSTDSFLIFYTRLEGVQDT